MLPFQVRLYQTEAVQVDAPKFGVHVNKYFVKEPYSTAGALLQAVSQQVGIPVKSLKLAYDYDGDGRYLGTVITNMSHRVDNRDRFCVVVEKDDILKKAMKREAETNLFIEDMTKLMDDWEISDFRLKCGSKIFMVHKAILGARSKVFRAMFLSGMKEAVDGEAVITDIDEKTLEEILNYLYSGKLSGKDFVAKSLCYAAKKYELDHLMDLICERIRAVKLEAGELADVFISAEMFYKREMFDIAMEKLKENKGMLKDKKFEEKIKEWPDLLYRIIFLII